MAEESNPRKKLGEYLFEAGLVTEQQLKEALRRQRQTKEPLGHILARNGMVSEMDVCRVLNEQLGLPIMDLQSLAIDEQVIALVREDLAKKYTAIPVDLENRNTVRVAMADPLNASALEDIRFQSGYFVRPVLAPPSEIVDAISKYYHIDASVVEILENIIKTDLVREVREITAGDVEENVDELLKVSAGPPIVRLANWLITRAVEMRASDIHIEPQEKGVGVRVRVDGLLQDLERLPKWTQGALISRVKILASLDIAEKRLPQDGGFRVEIDGRRIELRISTLPVAYGEKVVIRILDRERNAHRLDTLGLNETCLETLRLHGQRPQGIIIVTGPTGSGKTTLLYGLLQHIHTVTKNIITVEDPIEYQIAGINQVQVDERSKKTFTSVLRAMLRQDPDIMMLGEIRDLETAQIAFRASITGHLILTTVHTNDATSAVTRLVDLGLQPYMVASSLISVVSMRLVRMLCPRCRDRYVPSGEELRLLGMAPGTAGDLTLYRPVGCDYCGESGYRGRTGVFEILELDDSLRRLIASSAPESVIRHAAIEAGMVPIGEDGLAKVIAGETSLEELQRVVFCEEESGRLCPSCRATLSGEFLYCPHCGQCVSSACTRCERKLDATWFVCPYCGMRREERPLAEVSASEAEAPWQEPPPKPDPAPAPARRPKSRQRF